MIIENNKLHSEDIRVKKLIPTSACLRATY